MTSCTYRVLGFATSNLRAEDFVFAIAFRNTDVPKSRVICYVLDKWESLVEGYFPDEILYVENVFYDLRQQDADNYAETEALFAQMNHWNIGPLRTVASGTCMLHPPTNTELDVTLERDLLACPLQTFNSLLKLFLQD